MNKKTKQIVVRIPLGIYSRMRRYCAAHGLSITYMVVYLLNQIPDVDSDADSR